jgi:hypothetical protein
LYTENPTIFLVILILIFYFVTLLSQTKSKKEPWHKISLGNMQPPMRIIFVHLLRTQPVVEAENYEIKPNSLSLIYWNQFGGSTSEYAGLHLNTSTEICDMMRIKDVNPDVVRLRLFPFSLRGKAKYWLLSLPKGTVTSWNACSSVFMSNFFPPAKTMQLRSNITGFRQEDRKPLALA